MSSVVVKPHGAESHTGQASSRFAWRLPRTASAFVALVVFLLSSTALAAGDAATLDLTREPVGIAALILFVVAYAIVMGEEFLHMRKSKPVLVAAGLIWALIGWRYQVAAAEATDEATKKTLTTLAEHAVRHNILEYGELFLFLLAAMTYINTMEERGVFNALRGWLVTKGFSLRQIFWITGLLAFFISPVADNLTTALLMGAVAMAVGAGNTPFLVVAFINIVIAANAGGAFSPFGDITTLMVWQKGIIPFSGFFALFIPSLINWLVPAAFMSLSIGKSKPAALDAEIELRHGAFVIVGLFLATIVMAVSFHNFLHLPPVLGMMSGLGVLKLYGWTLKKRDHKAHSATKTVESDNPFEAISHAGAHKKEFDIFRSVEKAEWDTLMFFYGVILCVGGLGTLGYLQVLSHFAYDGFGATTANIAIGFLSALVDNIPVMFAVLSMHPAMDEGQWLLVTLTAGVGGSLLSIGSAAGVALMGQARGVYTFFAHLKWTWAIALGYGLSIGAHFLLNKSLFNGVAIVN
jgi:Na+/H+ antiporter NhaD/arsenite permease-like protein